MRTRTSLELLHDADADAARINFVDAIQAGGVEKSHVCDIELANCSVVLDFDAADHLVGIEILGASRLLPEQVLREEDQEL
jgi:uncharacterized protein YuzE